MLSGIVFIIIGFGIFVRNMQSPEDLVIRGTSIDLGWLFLLLGAINLIRAYYRKSREEIKSKK